MLNYVPERPPQDPNDPREPEPLDDYVAIFPCEYHAAQMLAELRWPDGFACRKCGHSGAAHLRTRPRVFQCQGCGAFNSVTAGTALHGTKVPLGKVLIAFHLLSRELSVSANRLRKIIGTRYETAWKLAHKIRAALCQDHGNTDPPEATSAVGVRIRRRAEERRFARFVGVQAVRSTSGEISAVVDQCKGPLGRQRLLEHGPPNAALRTPAHDPVPQNNVDLYRRLISSLQRTIHRVHQRVSRRWVRRYVQGWCRLQSANPFATLTRAVFAAAPLSWSRVAPPPLRIFCWLP